MMPSRVATVRWGLLAAQSARPRAGHFRVRVVRSMVRSGCGRSRRRGMAMLLEVAIAPGLTIMPPPFRSTEFRQTGFF